MSDSVSKECSNISLAGLFILDVKKYSKIIKTLVLALEVKVAYISSKLAGR